MFVKLHWGVMRHTIPYLRTCWHSPIKINRQSENFVHLLSIFSNLHMIWHITLMFIYAVGASKWTGDRWDDRHWKCPSHPRVQQVCVCWPESAHQYGQHWWWHHHSGEEMKTISAIQKSPWFSEIVSQLSCLNFGVNDWQPTSDVKLKSVYLILIGHLFLMMWLFLVSSKVCESKLISMGTTLLPI